MKVRYLFLASRPNPDGTREILATDLVIPGQVDLYRAIRAFADDIRFGKYQTFQDNPELPHFGHHVFDLGLIKINPVHI